MTKADVLTFLFSLVQVIFTGVAIVYFPFCAYLFVRAYRRYKRYHGNFSEPLDFFIYPILLTGLGLLIAGCAWYSSLPDAKMVGLQ